MTKFTVLPNLLSKSDPRYKKWRKSLKKRPAPWSKDFTKETHPSVLKISETFRKKKIDNFAGWRNEMKRLGKIRSSYPVFKKDGNFAELIGVILGDGHIEKCPRTESLSISSNARNLGFIQRYSNLVEIIFCKKPHISRERRGCVKIRVYQKQISKRLDIPCGSRKDFNFVIPKWIIRNKELLKKYLRGLYEAEGSFCIHKPTCTYKFAFSNRNESLLKNVFEALRILGFHPHRDEVRVQLSKKEEVYKIVDLIKFRNY